VPLIVSTVFSNMAEPTTPKHPRVTSIQHDSNVGRTPSQPTSHYLSSTKITEAKVIFKTVFATRVSYNDPNIVDILIKPHEIGDRFVQTVIQVIKVIVDFLTTVRKQIVRHVHTLGTSGSSVSFEYSRLE
jgi:hypothetical protein